MSITHSQELSVRLSPKNLEMGQNGILKVTVKGAGNIRLGNLSYPRIPGIVIAKTPSNHSQKYINGVQEISQSYRVLPQKPGKWEIPQLVIDLNSKKLVSDKISFEVFAVGEGPLGELPTNQKAFLKLYVPKNEVYIGESFTAKVVIFYNNQCREPTWPKLEAAGFNLSNKAIGDLYSWRINNRSYSVQETTIIASPLKVGNLELGPPIGTIKIAERSNRSFSLYSQLSVFDLKGDTQPIKVLPLPVENKPDSFNGVIGKDFIISYQVSPKNVPVGDPVTVKIDIAGKGNIRDIQLPSNLTFENFKTYEPKTDTIYSDKFTMEGRKSFEMIVIPGSETINSLPDLEFAYFDPEIRQYTKTIKPGPELEVTPSNYQSTRINSVNLKENSESEYLEDNQLAHISYKLSPTSLASIPLNNSMFIWMVPGIGLVFLVSAVTSSCLQNYSRKRDAKGLRMSDISKQRTEKINELTVYADSNQQASFFGVLFRLIQDELSIVTGISAELISRELIYSNEKIASLPDEHIDLLHQLFDWCDQVRFGEEIEGINLKEVLADFLNLSKSFKIISK